MSKNRGHATSCVTLEENVMDPKNRGSAFGLSDEAFVLPTQQAPHYYRFMLGDARATIVSDGYLPIGKPSSTFQNVAPGEVDRQLEDNFLPTHNMLAEQNVLVIELDGKIVVFDTGMGSLKEYKGVRFGETPGQLMKNLAVAGIDPASVSAVVLSHAHIDHCGGIIGEDDAEHFPNAEFFVSRKEFEYWTDIDQPNHLQRDQARRNLLPVHNRIHFVEDGEEFLPGVTAISTPGHSPGHMCFRIARGDQTLTFLGDLVHHHVLLVQTPLMEFLFDEDPQLSAQTRVKTLKDLAEGRNWCLGFHLPWPGLGHFVKDGEGYRFIASPMRMLPDLNMAEPELYWPE